MGKFSVRPNYLQEVNESPEILKYIWYPELEIYGLDTFGRQRVLKEMSGVRINKNKTITYELGVRITISCRMDFDNYPLDAQTCQFQVGSCKLDVVWCDESSRYFQTTTLTRRSPAPPTTYTTSRGRDPSNTSYRLRDSLLNSNKLSFPQVRLVLCPLHKEPTLLNVLSLRNLRGLRDPGEAPEEADAVPGAGLPSKLHVRGDQLGQLPHQA